MLSDSEKDGIRKILRKMSYNDLISLADTITKKQIVVLDRIEAMRSIIAYSDSAYELLRRKKMKREILFEYADECKIAMSPSIDKKQLVREILRHWGSSALSSNKATDDDTFDIDDGDDEDDRQSRSSSSSFSLSSSTRSTWSTPNGASSGAALTQTGMGDHAPFSHQLGFPNPTPSPAVASSPFGAAANPPISVGIYFVNAGPVQQQPPQEINTNVSATTAAPAESQRLAEAFVDWFYKMINSLNPASNIPPMEFGPVHFWPDVSMRLIARTHQNQSDDTFQGSELVCQRFLAMAREERLLFNPNLSPDGVRGISNPHGLVVVEVCGTLHRNAECLGIFQQVFGLIRDPTQENNWKVKWVRLDIQSGQPTAIPRLGAPDQQLHLTN